MGGKKGLGGDESGEVGLDLDLSSIKDLFSFSFTFKSYFDLVPKPGSNSSPPNPQSNIRKYSIEINITT